MSVVNPVLPPIALLRPKMPGIYTRDMIYDITWDDPSYLSYVGQKIVPALWSIVKDTDATPLWVIAVDPVTYVPTYEAVPLSQNNDNVVSLLNYGNSVLRLYVDPRMLPYPATPDTKCVFIGKSPRFYTLTRFAGTAQETIISQYYDATGKLVSTQVPLIALDSSLSSWHMPKCNLITDLDFNEEIVLKIYDETGAEIESALLFVKQSSVINEAVTYNPTIVGMTVSANQRLVNGTFYLYEKQDFSSLGLTVNLVYDDGSTASVPIDGLKCILYGQSDFISSFAGLVQTLTVKYYRSQSEALMPGLADSTGSMISTDINVTVIPNTLGVTTKLMVIPVYNASLARYALRYWLYYADGRSHTDVTAYVTISAGSVVTDASFFGIQQSYVASVDMSVVDPVRYPSQSVYQQTIVIRFGPPNTQVKWTIKDASSSLYIYGQDTASAHRPSLLYDATIKQYFIPSYIFINQAAFINSFYTQTSPPYDPQISQVPQTPTHFVIRDIVTGNMLIPAPIPVASYAQAFNIIGDTIGKYLNASVIVEFLSVVNAQTTNVLFGGCVDVTKGTYVG